MEIEVMQNKAVSKLIQARVKFQEYCVKPSGKNTHLRASYFELSDILPVVNLIGQELGFACVVSFNEIATLDFIDSETGQSIQFTSPMSTADLKNCHAVQNLGAVQTYIKRYLYQNAFEIIEADMLNGSYTSNEPVKPTAAPQQQKSRDYKQVLLDHADVKNNPDRLAFVQKCQAVNEGKYSALKAKWVL